MSINDRAFLCLDKYEDYSDKKYLVLYDIEDRKNLGKFEVADVKKMNPIHTRDCTTEEMNELRAQFKEQIQDKTDKAVFRTMYFAKSNLYPDRYLYIVCSYDLRVGVIYTDMNKNILADTYEELNLDNLLRIPLQSF